MKKYLLFATMLFASMGLMAQMDASSALPFDWDEGIQITEAGTYLYKVELDEAHVPTGDNIILYLNNPSNESIDVTVQAYSLKSNGVSLSPLSDEEVKTIAPNRKYALELASALFRAFDAVYVRITVDKPIGFDAEPVEPGEKNLDCLNAPVFNWAGTTLQANKETWYTVDLTAAVEDATKTVEISLKNTGSETATVKVGVSFDCPSTGTTEKTITIAAGETKTTKVARSYFQMLPADNSLYLQVNSTQRLSMSAKLVAAEAAQTVTVENPQDVVADQEYTLNGSQWYRVKVADFNVKGQLPEVTVENTAASAVELKAEVVYALTGEEPISRTATLAKGGIIVREVARNIIETAAAKGEYVYVRVTANNDVRFSVRMKARTEGDACKSAKEFALWDVENLQAANTTIWYAIDITDAKAATTKDIQITILNKQGQAATVKTQVAFDCPYTATQDMQRTIAANAEVAKRIVRSTYATLAVNTIYVGVTTDKNVSISASLIDAEDYNDDSCVDNYIDFDLDNGHVQPAGAQWYRIDIDALNRMEKVPEITIKNREAVATTVKGELAFECPVTAAMQTKSFSIAANGEKVITPTRDMLKNIDGDVTYAYIRVTSATEISLTTEMKYEDEGEKCATAIDFNWTVGHDQEAGSTVWYAVDITAVKAAEQAIRLSLKNKESEQAKVNVEVYFDCDSNTPQTASATLAGGQEKTKEVASGIIASNSADVVYIKVTTDRNIHIQATTFEDEKVNICDYNFVEFDWESGHTQAASAVWYKASLQPLRDNPALTAQVLIRNNEAAAAKVVAEVTFNCANAATTSKTQTLKANQELVKMIERDVVNQYVQNDTVYFLITTDKEIFFQVELVDPNQGQDCGHAIDFDWENGHVQEEGATVWYKIDLSNIKGQDKAVRLHIDNLDGFSGKVIAAVYGDCGEEAMREQTITLGANAQKSKELGADVFNAVGSVLYVRLETYQQDRIWAEVYDDETPKTDACLDAKDMLLNIDIAQEAGEQWYVLDLRDIRDNTEGDATLRIAAQTADNKLKAEVAFSCPAPVEMQSRTLSLKAGQAYERVIERSVLSNTDANKAYIRITSEQAISFRIDVIDHRGETCDNPIIFDWVKGNIHPGDGSALWYEVRLDTMTLDENLEKDLRVNVQNLTSETLAASAVIKGDCAEDALFSHDYSMAGDALKSKDIMRDMIESMTSFAPIRIQLTADKQVHLTAELIGEIERDTVEVTVNDTLCAGTAYFDLWGKPLLVVENDTVIKQTVEFTHDQTLLGDSIVTYDLKVRVPFVLPASFTGLTVERGAALDVTAATTDILSQIEAASTDLTEKVDTLYWRLIEEGQEPQELPAAVAADAEDIALRYVVVGECGTQLQKDTLITFKSEPVVEPVYEVYTEDIEATICAGATYVTRTGAEIVVTEATKFSETVRVTETETLIVDSVYNYDIKVYASYTLPAGLNNLPTAMCGDAGIDVEATTAEIAEYLATQTNVPAVDSITWEIEYSGKFEALDAQIMHADAYYRLRYTVHTECEDLTNDDIRIEVAPKYAEYNNETSAFPIAIRLYEWVVLVNEKDLNTLPQFADAPVQANEIQWYRVVGSVDEIDPETGLPLGDDTQLNTGFYHTTETVLVGDYYAVITRLASDDDECGSIIRSNVTTLTADAQFAPRLTPSYPALGADIELSGLNPNDSYEINVYDVAGQVVESHNVTGTDKYIMQAAQQAGYYVVDVRSAKDQQSLKYITK